MRRAVLAVATALVLASGCGGAFRPFSMRPVVWHDDDATPFEGPIPEQFNSSIWDVFDNTVFRQVSDTLTYPRAREAIDVNALDEVPDSSWFTNRISRHDMTAGDLMRGSCSQVDPPPPPYVVVLGKFDGTSPGAVIEASDGHRYLLKIDIYGQPERATAADSIGTRILHAAGYHVPCNFVLAVRAEDLSIAPDARRRRGSDEPFDPADLAFLLDHAGPGPTEDTRRVSLSRYMDGRPLGGFRFQGVRGDDPNDVVPHEHRRELRGFYVMSAWLNHVDARAENNLDMWIETSEGHGYVRHAVLDAGDSFGLVWGMDVDHGVSRRLGNAHYLDIEQIIGDIATLGFAERAYRDPVRGPAFEVFGYYDVERFDPDDWRNGYPNAAFERRTEADNAWMARIIARMGEPEIRALVETGHFSRDLWRDELVRILMGRRERLLERYLVRVSPLSFPEVSEGRLCLRDLAVESGLRDASEREYSARAFEGIPPSATLATLAVDASTAGVCVELPRTTSTELPRYHVVDVFAGTPEREHSHPARVHLWEVEPGVHHLAGLERPDSDATP